MEEKGLNPVPAASEQKFDNATEVVENSIVTLQESEPETAPETNKEVESETPVEKVEKSSPEGVANEATDQVKTTIEVPESTSNEEPLIEKIEPKESPEIEENTQVNEETESENQIAETTETTVQVDDISSKKEQEATNQINEYAGKSKKELVEILANSLVERPIQQLRSTVEAIKISFYKILRAEIEVAKNAFIEAGNTVENFTADADELEIKLKDLISEYRKKRDHYIANIEQEKEKNYKAKIALIDELKELANSSETLHNTFAAFRDLQNRWKEIGIVPQEKIKDLWDTYHHHVENFYNFIKINKELRDIDLKRNYEAKIILCEEAEALMLEPSATSAFHKLQKLHDEWREIGPVALEFKDQIWERFKEASTRINKRHQEYYDSIKDEQEKNLNLKEELCLKVEELTAQPFTSRKEWGDASDQITEIQKIWKTIGFAPKKDNTLIYERFRTACDKFFEAKREFFGGMKNEMDDNLQVKIDLCVQAESLSESEDWKAATETLIELQKKWKESGAVARKHADEVWKRFRSACDKFFERKSEHFNNIDSKFSENLEAKKKLLQELVEAAENQAELTFDKLKEYQRRWSEIGFVPIKQKEAIAKQYKEVVDKLFAILRGGEGERRIERFKERVNSFKDNAKGKISNERDKLYNRVRQIESDIQVWENNIGFFAKSKNADALVKEVEKKIEKAKAEIAEIIEKVKLIDNTDNK